MQCIKKFWNSYKFPLIVFFVWYALLSAVTQIQAALNWQLNPTFPYYDTDLANYPRTHATRAFFDGVHYLRIADYGYQETGTQAFFPLYPLLVRAGAELLSANRLWTGIVISGTTTLLALLVIWNTLKPKLAKRTILLLMAFPTAFFLATVYTEGLFLLEVALWLRAVRNRKFAQAALISGLATATRAVGIALAVGTAAHYIAEVENRSVRGFARAIVIALLSSSGLIVYMIFLWKRFGNALMFQSVQPLFGGGRTGEGIITPLRTVWRYAKILTTADPTTLVYVRSLAELMVFVLAVWLLVKVWQKHLVAETTMATVALFLPTLTGSLSSMPRYVLVILPLWIAWTQKMSTKTWWVTVVGLGALQIAAFLLFASGQFVA